MGWTHPFFKLFGMPILDSYIQNSTDVRIIILNVYFSDIFSLGLTRIHMFLNVFVQYFQPFFVPNKCGTCKDSIANSRKIFHQFRHSNDIITIFISIQKLYMIYLNKIFKNTNYILLIYHWQSHEKSTPIAKMTIQIVTNTIRVFMVKTENSC